MPDTPEHIRCLDEIAAAIEHNAIVGVVLVELPGIGHADTVLGYRAGDQLCAQAKAMLQQALGPTDRLFLISRDQIACLLPALPTPAHCTLAAHKILRTLDIEMTLDAFRSRGLPVVGAAVRTAADQDADALLRCANAAMTEARKTPGRLAFYDNRLDNARRFQIELQTCLRDALDDNGLDIHFQPKMSLANRSITGAEALLRWHHPVHGKIPPSTFIPIAEAGGIISDLTLWVLHGALRHYAAFQAQVPGFNIAVNLSPLDLLEPDLPDAILQALKLWNVPPRGLTLELTETATTGEHADFRSALDHLKETGIQISIDDFGTGYSSMTRLRDMPLDELKIDLSFIKPMLTSPQDERIVRSIVDLGHHLDVRVVAEGVEDQATLEHLTSIGCDGAQGYFISAAVPGERLCAFLAGQESNAGCPRTSPGDV